MSDDLFADGIDGVHGLRRRGRTRLWYRSMPQVEVVPECLRTAIQHAAHLNVVSPELLDAVNLYPFMREEPAADDGGFDLGSLIPPVAEATVSAAERQERILRRLGMHEIVPATEAHARSSSVLEPLTDWRTVPA